MLTVPRRYFYCGSLLLLVLAVHMYTWVHGNIFQLSKGNRVTTCLGKTCSFGLPRVPFVNCCQFMYLFISLLVLRTEYGM